MCKLRHQLFGNTLKNQGRFRPKNPADKTSVKAKEDLISLQKAKNNNKELWHESLKSNDATVKEKQDLV